jgi:hypothetical protein
VSLAVPRAPFRQAGLFFWEADFRTLKKHPQPVARFENGSSRHTKDREELCAPAKS